MRVSLPRSDLAQQLAEGVLCSSSAIYCTQLDRHPVHGHQHRIGRIATKRIYGFVGGSSLITHTPSIADRCPIVAVAPGSIPGA